MKRHPTDVLSLTAGLLFLVLAIFYGFDSAGGFSPDLRLVIPAILIVLGTAGMVSAVRAQRRNEQLADADRPTSDAVS